MTKRVVRTGISIEPQVLATLDTWVRQRNCGSRSEAIRMLVRRQAAEHALEDPEADAVACLALIYRHDRPNVLRRLAAAQHRWGTHIRFSGHVHLEGGSCLEVLALAGRQREVVAAAEDLRGVKGVAFGEYTLADPGVAGGRSGHRHPHRA
ncbi:MAG: hypothetical protein L3J97_01425 [Thermoplasmata archaeon]|nr:hypothetical protein [Thermoplasmata archaeon]